MTETKEIAITNPESVFAGKPDDQFPVDARKLHAWLGVESQFNLWIPRRIEEFAFEVETDWIAFFDTRQGGRRNQKEYRLSLSMAKELAMVERNAKGREIRKYFISCEEKLKQVSGQTKKWSIAREEGKYARRVETDIIKAFIEYAKAQGSQSADMYFMNFSKMVNAALLDFDGKAPEGLRDSLNTIQLHAISVAETIIARCLVECMTQKLPYKDVYQIAKTKIADYAKVVGKTRPGISARQLVGLVA